MCARIAAVNLFQVDFGKSLNFYDTVMYEHLCPVAPLSNGRGGSASVMHARCGVPVLDIIACVNSDCMHNRCFRACYQCKI